MEAPSSLKRFHLILAHDIRDTDSSRRSVHKFWAARFPDALITDFPFLDETSNVRFLNRAHALLSTIQEARESENYPVGPEEHLPNVFLCHGLGGSLVKQALVLASLDRNYGRYASDTALLILCSTPDAAEHMNMWQLEICRLLTVSDLGSYSVTSLLNELPEALERLYWSFGAIRRHHLIVDIEPRETGSNMRTRSTHPARGRSTIRASADEATLWSFSPGEPTSEKIFDRISKVVKQEIQPLSEQFHRFMQLLRNVDSNNYQLELTRPFTSSIELITKDDAFRDWRRIDPDAPNLLQFWTPQGIGSAAIASHLIETLDKSVEDCTVISYSFNKQDLRTQPITTFYVSLIRQLLLSQLSLFRRVSAIGDWIENERNFSYEIFRGLFLSLLKGASPNPIICVIHAAQDCAGFSLDHLVDLIKEYRRLSRGIFKVVVLNKEPSKGAWGSDPDICREIDLSNAPWSAQSIAGYVKSQVEALARNQPHWRGCEEEIINKLSRPSLTYMQASTSITLLDSEKIPSTRSAALQTVKRLPTSRDEVYAAVVDRCERECPLPLKPLLQWVLHSVRPLSMNELAVVIGLANSGSSSIENLRSHLPLDIMSDIRQVKDTVVRTVGLQALPVHKTIVPVLDEKWRLTDQDANSVMLRTCLGYLEMILADIPTCSPPRSAYSSSQSSRSVSPVPESENREAGRLSSPSSSRVNQRLDIATNLEQTSNIDNLGVHLQESPTGVEEKEPARLYFDLNTKFGLEHDLLEYAVLNWPEHYKRVRRDNTIKDQILSLFNKSREIQAWAALFQKFADEDTEKFKRLDSLLNIGCRFGLFDIVEGVLQGESPLSSKTALSDGLDLAVGFGHEDIVCLLLAHGAESNEAPSLAAEFGFLNILKHLIQANPSMSTVEDKTNRTPFLLAALSGNEDIASYLMANGAEHTTAAGNDIMGLHVAAMTGQLGLLRKLIDAGSDIHATLRDEKRNSLMLAAAGGFDDIVKFLLSRGARINDRDYEGETALCQAIKHGHSSTCGLLFAAGADIHSETSNGMSAIHIAAKNGYLDILRELLDRSKELLNEEIRPLKLEVQPSLEVPADEESQASQSNMFDDSADVSTPLELAASNGHLEVTRELLQYPRFNSEKSRATALFKAASGGFHQVVEELLKTNITTVIKDTNGNNALHLATQEQYPDIVDCLIHSDSNLKSIFEINAQNNSGWTPLHLAARSGRLITVQILLRNGASISSVNSSEETALHISAYQGHKYVVNELIDHFKKHPAQDDNLILMEDNCQDTPFVIAVREGHYAISDIFIKNIAPLEPIQLQGKKQALIAATSRNNSDLVKLLLDHNWDVNARDDNGETALHMAAEYNHPSIMELLIGRGADCNSRNNREETPLHQATRSGKVSIQLLLNAGADIDAIEEEGATPLWLAAFRGRRDAVEALLDWTPKPCLDIQDIDGWTALHACYDDSLITKMLLQAGADPTIFQKYGQPSCFLAATSFSGHDTIQAYVDAHVDIHMRDKKGSNLLHETAVGGRIETFRLLHSRGVDIRATDENGETPLHLAAAKSDGDEILQYILEQDVDLEADCKRLGTPLMAAVKGGWSAANSLLQKGANVNAASISSTYTALQTAASEKYECVELLIDAGADANLRGGSWGSALCAATAKNNKSSVMLLLDKDENINYADGPKGSALELALSHQSLEIAELLFDRGVDVNVVSKGKHGTALIAAVDSGEIRSVEKLLELKADLDLFPPGRESPVQLAVRKGRQNIVEVLVRNGATLDYRDRYGRGVLSHAIINHSIDLLPYILQQPGIDVDAQDLFGDSPLIVAALEGNAIIQDILALKPKINAHNIWGQTALVIAIRWDYGLIVSELIEAKVDLLIQDIRGRDALYWAALESSSSIFELILNQLNRRKELEIVNSVQYSLSAAIAADKVDFVRQLLAHPSFVDGHVDQDGWTADYTAQRYNRENISSLIAERAKNTGRSKRDQALRLKPPTQWHPKDKAAYLALQPDSLSIQVHPEFHLLDFADYSLARADHPMVPINGETYYFEVTIVNQSDEDCICAVGFCREEVMFSDMLGWEEGSWGYHSDDGNSYESRPTGNPFGPAYDKGGVVGCGVNFEKETAFFTLNGKVIGRIPADVRGKLYPAVSMSMKKRCTMTARFWSKSEEANKLFMFRGPYDGPETLQLSERYNLEGENKQTKRDDDSASYSSADSSD